MTLTVGEFAGRGIAGDQAGGTEGRAVMTEGPIYHDPRTGHPYRVGPDGVSQWIVEDPADRPTEVHPSLPVTEVHRPLQQTQAFWLDTPGSPAPPLASTPASAPGTPSRRLVVVLGSVAGVAVLLVVVLAAALVLRKDPASDGVPVTQVPTVSAPTSTVPTPTDPAATDPATGGEATPSEMGPGWRPADYRALPDAVASGGDLEVRVEGLGTTKSIGRTGLQTATGTYLLLYVSFRNSGSHLTMPMFAKLTDATGVQYNEAAGASGAVSGLVYGPTGLAVQPGQTGHRIMAFDVPVDTSPTQVSLPTGLMAPSVTVPLG
jgi:hypothetical protein